MPGKPAELRNTKLGNGNSDEKYRVITSSRKVKYRIQTFVSEKNRLTSKFHEESFKSVQEMATFDNFDNFTGDHTKVHFLSLSLKHTPQFLRRPEIQKFKL